MADRKRNLVVSEASTKSLTGRSPATIFSDSNGYCSFIDFSHSAGKLSDCYKHTGQWIFPGQLDVDVRSIFAFVVGLCRDAKHSEHVRLEQRRGVAQLQRIGTAGLISG
ncbi:hypothetical protein PG987_015668 [Apiospora arundinis]